MKREKMEELSMEELSLWSSCWRVLALCTRRRETISTNGCLCHTLSSHAGPLFAAEQWGPSSIYVEVSFPLRPPPPLVVKITSSRLCYLLIAVAICPQWLACLFNCRSLSALGYGAAVDGCDTSPGSYIAP